MDEKGVGELLEEGDREVEKEWGEIVKRNNKLPELLTAPFMVRDVKLGEYVFVHYEFMVEGGFTTELPCGIGKGQARIMVVKPKVGAEVSIESARKAIEEQEWQVIKGRPKYEKETGKDVTFMEELESL